MTKENIIAFDNYAKTRSDQQAEQDAVRISQELEQAIKQLIQRLRDAEPIRHCERSEAI